MWTPQARRLLFISLEYERGCFSGNGVYAQSQVRALRSLGHEVLVLAGCPEANRGDSTASAAEGSNIIEVSCPHWGRLDFSCGWQAFAAGAGAHSVAAALVAFRPDAVLGVDWHAVLALQAAAGQSGVEEAHRLNTTPFVYLNYRAFMGSGWSGSITKSCILDFVAPAARVYSRSGGHVSLDKVKCLEQAAVAAAAAVICLSRSDAQYITSHLLPGAYSDSHSADDGNAAAGSRSVTINGGETLLPVSVLLPALRSDMDRLPLPPDMATATTAATNQPSTDGSSAALVAASSREATQMQQQGGAQRRYLTCCVRLSPEKEAHRFVALIEAMARPAPTGRATGASPAAVSGAGDAESVGSPRSQLEAVGVVPLMCGAASTEYGAALQARLLAAAPCAVVESRFLPPAELAKIFAATKLNVHPCVYDAYGMTVVEAASQGAPSVVMGGGAVGATDLLKATAGECFTTNMAAPPDELAAKLEGWLRDEAVLAQTGAQAAQRARSWNEAANAARLMEIVEAVLLRLASPQT